MEKFLPQSPQGKEVIKSLTSKFNIEVQLGQKVGKQKIVLREQENQWLIEFLNWPDISYSTPGKRECLFRESQ